MIVVLFPPFARQEFHDELGRFLGFDVILKFRIKDQADAFRIRAFKALITICLSVLERFASRLRPRVRTGLGRFARILCQIRPFGSSSLVLPSTSTVAAAFQSLTSPER